MGHNPIPPPPPQVPLHGDGERRDLDYCRELYALDRIDEAELEARVERILRGDRDAIPERRFLDAWTEQHRGIHCARVVALDDFYDPR